MKALLLNLATLLIFSVVVTMGFATGYCHMKAYQNHLEQQVIQYKYKARRLEINIDAIYNENLQLRIELERHGAPQPVAPSITTQSTEKSC
jgi:hypothetical protein